MRGSLWALFTPGLQQNQRPDIRIWAFFGLLVLLAIGLLLLEAKRMTVEKAALLFLAAFFLVHLAYCLYTGIYTRQHDVYDIGERCHLDYIYILYDTHQLPDSYHHQLYHPPLHHAIGAVWLGLGRLLTGSVKGGMLGLRFLPLAYITLASVVCWRILRSLGLKGGALLAAFVLAAGHPTLTILSSSINNDALAWLLTLAAFYRGLRWYRQPTMKNILQLALWLGLAGLAKLSCLLLAVPLGFLFLMKLLEKNRPAQPGPGLWPQFFAFGGVSIPLGLSHSVYNFIRLGQPLGYVLAINSPAQYVGDIRLRYRFLAPFSENLFKNVYCMVVEDYNVWEYILRCSLFGEYRFEGVDFLARLLTVLNAALGLGCLAAVVWLIVRRPFANAAQRWMSAALLILCGAVLASYLMFNLNFPNACTMDFRYLLPLMLGAAAALGWVYQAMAAKKGQAALALRVVIWGVVGAFTLASAAFYLLVT